MSSATRFEHNWQAALVKLRVVYLLKKNVAHRQLYGLLGEHPSVRRPKTSIKLTVQQKLPSFVLSPSGSLKNVWNVILATLLVYTATVMPFSMAFIDSTKWDDWFMMQLSVDALFFLDILVNLVSAYHGPDGRLISGRRKIVLNYFKTWMLIDILACVPFGLFEDQQEQQAEQGEYNNMLRLVRLPRLYRLVRISRLVKMVKHYKKCEVIERIQDFLSIKHSFMRLLGSFMTILLCVHIVTCFWYYTAKLEGFHPDTWVVRGGYVDMSVGTLYITSMYWCLTTLSTVGYGDIVPFTMLQKVMAISWMIFGIYFISFTIGSLSSMLSSIDTKKNALVEKLAAIDEFAKQANLEKSLKLRLSHALRYSTEKTGFSWSDKQSIFNELPKSLKHNIAKEMHRGATKRLTFFANKDQAMISDIVPFLVPTSFKPEDFVYNESEHADEIYFLVKGSVLYKAGTVKIMYFDDGDEFGDVEVVLQKPRLYGAFTTAYSEVLVMNRMLVGTLQSEYCSVWEDMKAAAAQKQRQFLRRKIQADVKAEGQVQNKDWEVERRLNKIERSEKTKHIKSVHMQHQTVSKKKEVTLKDLYEITDNLLEFINKLDGEMQGIKKSVAAIEKAYTQEVARSPDESRGQLT